MFSLKRVHAVALRYLVSMKTDFGRLIDMTYWPALDITLIGFMGAWTTHAQGPAVLGGILASMSLWQIILGINNEICMSMLEEVWDQNMVNMFATPLSCLEWLFGIMMVSIFRGLVVVTVAGIAAYCWFGFNLLSPALFIFIPVLILCGWFSGLLSGSAILNWGDRVQQIAWMGAWFYAALSGVFCPVEMLPHAFQVVGAWLPMTHLFKAIRLYYIKGILDIHLLQTAALLAGLYFVVSLLLCKYMFEKSRNKGLARRR